MVEATVGRAAAGGRKTREQRRAEAEARNAWSRATKDLRERIAGLDRKSERLRAREAELSTLIASPEAYADPLILDPALEEYSRVHEEREVTEADWLDLSAEMERIEREGST